MSSTRMFMMSSRNYCCRSVAQRVLCFWQCKRSLGMVCTNL